MGMGDGQDRQHRSIREDDIVNTRELAEFAVWLNGQEELKKTLSPVQLAWAYEESMRPPPPVCSKCGIPEEESEWGKLFDVRVVTSYQEEGHADVTQLLCETCWVYVQTGLRRLGFVDHRHGGINFLEDENCPGHKVGVHACPRPSEYGGYTVQPWGTGH